MSLTIADMKSLPDKAAKFIAVMKELLLLPAN